MATLRVPSVSREYVKGPVTSDVELDTQTVEVAVLGTTEQPDETTTWVAVSWDPDTPVATTRPWRMLIGPSSPNPLTPGTYALWVRVTGVTEMVVRKHSTQLEIA